MQLSVQGCSDKFLLDVDTSHLPADGIDEWRRSQQQKRAHLRQETASKGPKVTRPLLREERHWGMSEEEIAAEEASDWQRTVAEQTRIINFTDKQRKDHHKAYVDAREKRREEEERYERRLAEVYRQKRMQRLSKEVREKLDLERQFRERIHI